MIRLSSTLSLVGLLYLTLFLRPIAARDTSMVTLNAKRLAAVERWRLSARGLNVEGNARRSTDATTSPRVKNITFRNPKASRFYVDGTTIPLVNFDVGPSWSGLIPISSAPHEKRKLFFWLFPPGPEGSLDDLIFWYSAHYIVYSAKGLADSGVLQDEWRSGLFVARGFLPGERCKPQYIIPSTKPDPPQPFTWATGTALPIQNEWSWTNLSSVLYVEQPVGTGFSQGTPTAKDENDVAAQLVGFLEQFLEIFSELKGKKFYLLVKVVLKIMALNLRWIEDIANFIYENTTRSTLDLDLQGIWINDPVLGWDVVQSQIPAVSFVHKYEHVFAFSQTFLAHLDSVAETCNYADYNQKHVTYPPQGLLPLPGKSTEADPGCDVWDTIFDAALLVNPAFNIYRIFDTVMADLSDVLGFPGSFFQAQVSPLYFNRADVKAAIHAPANVDWAECSNIDVFPHGDGSLPPAFTVLPNVIEKSNRTVIVHGLGDFILIAEGTRIVLQNMTWAGKQGFHKHIVEDSFIVDGVGSLGNMHSERGLSYVEISLAGHMVPGYSPVVSALKLLKWMEEA
ncbi:Alpha/Beta hydrolase protein [Multifurca ochricompacta]|uniref:Alpha/Beta hydrolase protein n=1 Tax=Multifurca ochricompacta TaxID=376703 RepID=A0AAD4QP64_9AGAM|nr:Alpha/Beta hydrolase protein [Multifurca ochricompacta]